MSADVVFVVAVAMSVWLAFIMLNIVIRQASARPDVWMFAIATTGAWCWWVTIT